MWDKVSGKIYSHAEVLRNYGTWAEWFVRDHRIWTLKRKAYLRFELVKYSVGELISHGRSIDELKSWETMAYEGCVIQNVWASERLAKPYSIIRKSLRNGSLRLQQYSVDENRSLGIFMILWCFNRVIRGRARNTQSLSEVFGNFLEELKMPWHFIIHLPENSVYYVIFSKKFWR